MSIIPFPVNQHGCGCRTPEWISLPVAPRPIARIRFFGESKFPQAVPLNGTLTWVADLLEQGSSIAGFEINGPGDPLVTLAETQEILAFLSEQYPQFPLGITTLGIGLAEHIGELSDHGVTQVTLLVDAVSKQTAQNLYAWIRPGKKNISLLQGVEMLIDEQAKGILACNKVGIPVTIQTTIYAGCNEQEIEKIAKRASNLGAESMTLLPGKGFWEDGESLLPPSEREMEELAEQAEKHIDFVCLQLPKTDGDIIPLSRDGAMPKPTKDRPNVAVLSANGMDIDLHLGQAIKALVYGPREDGLACLIEARDLPEPGGGDTRWKKVAETLEDCFVLLAASAGQKPRDILSRKGLPLLLVEENVEGTVDALYGGGKKKKRNK